MSTLKFLETIGRNLGAFVEPVDPIYLGAFFAGCVEVNSAIRKPIRKMLKRLPGPSQADPWSRAALKYPSAESVRILLDTLCQACRDESFEEGLSSLRSCITAVAESVREGRPGMMLGQVSVLWLRNYISGYHAALRWWRPEQADIEATRMRDLNAWIAARYGEPEGATWDRLMRVFEGECQSGVERFVELWEAWCKKEGDGHE